MLRSYYIDYRPKKWLFEGQNPLAQYSERNLEQVLKKSIIIAKINKPVSLHWLLISYATLRLAVGILENEIDLRSMQELLGYTSSRTTEQEVALKKNL